mgnify:CR=1 FL=1
MTLSFVKSSFWILFIANTANVAQYSSQLILGRYLQVADYGIFNAGNSLSLVVVTFVAVIPFIVSKYMIRFQHDLDFRNKLLQKITNFVFFSNLLFFVFLFIFDPYIFTFLSLTSHLINISSNTFVRGCDSY